MLRYEIRNKGSFILVTGFVVSLGKQTRINAPRSCIVDIQWKDGRLPSGVKVGSRVTIIGQFVTVNLGKGYYINNAQALKPAAMARIKSYIEKEEIGND